MGSKTAIELVQRATGRLQVDPPRGLFNSGNLGALFLNLLNEELEELVRKKGPDKQGWPILNKSHEFRTVAGQADYVLPLDAESFLSQTLYVDNPGIKIDQVSPGKWSFYKSLQGSAPIFEYVYLLGADELTDQLKISFQPVPTTEEVFRLEYISKLCVRAAHGQAPSLSEVISDNNTTVFPDSLVSAGIIWRYKDAVDLPFLSDAARYDKILDEAFDQVIGRQELILGRRGTSDESPAHFPAQSWDVGEIG